MTTNQTDKQPIKKRWLSIDELAEEFRNSRQIPFSQIKASSKSNKSNGSIRYDRNLIDSWLEANATAVSVGGH